MKAALEGYRVLVEIARADGEIGKNERVILERYRSALRVTSEQARAVEASAAARGISAATISEDEKIHVLQMMYRVAYADERLHGQEKKRLEQVAERLGLTRVQVADVEVRTEKRVQYRRRARKGVSLLAAVVVVAVVAGAYFMLREARSHSTWEAAAHDELLRLEGRIERVGESPSPDLERLEADLSARIAAIAAAATAPDRDEWDALTIQLEEIRDQLAELRLAETVFKDIERRYRDSVVLVGVRYVLSQDGTSHDVYGFGTGFFVSPDGLIVTNKHVVQPWKFTAEVARMLDDGWSIDPATVELAAWHVGATLIREDKRLDLGTAYSTGAGTLELMRVTPDTMERRVEPLPGGVIHEVEIHVQDNSDLALLRATVARPIRPIPLQVDASAIEKLDRVIVLGFPSGLGILETRRAETSPSLGEVRKVEDTVFISASIVPGNSGGPVLDRRGRALAVATRTSMGEATLGSCIQTRHILPLLPGLQQLLDGALVLADAGHPEHAAALLDLAQLKAPEPESVARVTAQRERLRRR